MIDINEYAKYSGLNQFAYSCITELMDSNQLIWKLLKYKEPDAWNQANLSESEKRSMIYKGGDDSSNYNVFLDEGQPDVLTSEVTVLRIYPYSIIPENRVVGTVHMMFSCYAHYKVNHLSNYTTRTDTIIQEILTLFNGKNIGGIGKLSFDRLGSPSARLESGGQIPFKGKWLLMSNKST